MTEAREGRDADTARAGQWPAEVDLDILRATYPDLADMQDERLNQHWRDYGHREGRLGAVPLPRESLITLASCRSLLEIGPFCQPVFTGPHVRYLDILDAESLRRRAGEVGLDPSRCPEEIHYTRGLGEAAGAQFDILFSSHNLEHQPDLVRHLREAEAALKPGGIYMMLIPDKRYCFDHFLDESTLADVLGAYAEQRTVHLPGHVIEHVAFTCHNDTVRHWQGDHGPAPDGLDGRVQVALNQIEAAGGAYIDVHAWQFTPASFRSIVTALKTLGLTAFNPTRVYETPWGRNEFAVVLSLGTHPA